MKLHFSIVTHTLFHMTQQKPLLPTYPADNTFGLDLYFYFFSNKISISLLGTTEISSRHFLVRGEKSELREFHNLFSCLGFFKT